MCKQPSVRRKGNCKNKPTKDGYCTYHYNKLSNKESSNISVDTCKQLLSRGNTYCTKNAKFDGYCSFHYNRLFNKPKEIIKNHEGPTKKCTYTGHSPIYSPYPREAVPIEKFIKPNRPADDLYKYCVDCRNSLTRNKNKSTDNFSNMINNEPDFLVCPSMNHNYNGVSLYPRNKVPKKMFLKNPEDPKSICKYCSDCRKYSNNIMDNSLISRKEKIKTEKDKFFCFYCRRPKSIDERAINNNGEPSVNCISCKIKCHNRKKDFHVKRKKIYRKVQYEIMLKCQSSCEECNSIFLKPEKNTKHVIELKTRKENSVLVVDYKGNTYPTEEFLNRFKDLLEFRILDFDHLPEDDLRKREILGPDEKYVGKRNYVTKLHNEFEIRKEAKVCQLICCRCHTQITYARCNKTKLYGKRLKKREYTNRLKSTGCSECGFYDKTMLYFLEFDHLDPTKKVDCISVMATKDKFSLEDVAKECLKTRILCRFCHRIHTSEQIKLKII